MATCKDAPLRFTQTCGNSFYFEATECVSNDASPETELCSDAFKIGNIPTSNWIQTKDQKYLVLNTSVKLKFEDKTTHEREDPDCQFFIQTYRDSNPEHSQPVMLYAYNDGQKMMVSCKNEKEVSPEPIDPNGLNNIDTTEHKALFRWRWISNGKYKFESTMYTGHFLAFEPVEGFSCVYKLILRAEPKDEVDESLVMGVTNCKLK